jgi:hypothetical protein
MKKLSLFKIALILVVSAVVGSCDLLTKVPIVNMSLGLLLQFALIIEIIAVVIIAYFLSMNKQ